MFGFSPSRRDFTSRFGRISRISIVGGRTLIWNPGFSFPRIFLSASTIRFSMSPSTEITSFPSRMSMTFAMMPSWRIPLPSTIAYVCGWTQTYWPIASWDLSTSPVLTFSSSVARATTTWFPSRSGPSLRMTNAYRSGGCLILLNLSSYALSRYSRSSISYRKEWRSRSYWRRRRSIFSSNSSRTSSTDFFSSASSAIASPRGHGPGRCLPSDSGYGKDRPSSHPVEPTEGPLKAFFHVLVPGNDQRSARAEGRSRADAVDREDARPDFLDDLHHGPRRLPALRGNGRVPQRPVPRLRARELPTFLEPLDGERVPRAPVDHGGEQERPDARRGRHVVPATADRDPAAVAPLPCNLVEPGARVLVRLRREPQVRERIPRVGVRARLREQHLRAEGLREREDDGVERVHPRLVPRVRGQRDVHGVPAALALADLVDEARAREQVAPVLVEGDREDARVPVEHGLHAVPVVRVDVHVEHALDAPLEEAADPDRAVVEDAEPGGLRGHRVVEPAAEVVRARRSPLKNRVHREEGAAYLEGRRLVHAAERWVVPGAEAELERLAPRVRAELLHDGDVVALVHGQEVEVRRGHRPAFPPL